MVGPWCHHGGPVFHLEVEGPWDKKTRRGKYGWDPSTGEVDGRVAGVPLSLRVLDPHPSRWCHLGHVAPCSSLLEGVLQ